MLTESAEFAGTSIWRQALPTPEPEPLGAGPGRGGGPGRHRRRPDGALGGLPCPGRESGDARGPAGIGAHRPRGLVPEYRDAHPGVGQDLTALIRRFGADAARAMYLESLRAVEYVGELAGREGIDAGLRMTGQLVVAQVAPAVVAWPGRRRRMEALGLPCERLDDRRLRERLSVAAEAPGATPRGRRPSASRSPGSCTRAACSRASSTR